MFPWRRAKRFGKDLSARGMAVGDLDNDGDIDIVISQTDGTPVILRNDGTKNHWLGLDLRGLTKARRTVKVRESS